MYRVFPSSRYKKSLKRISRHKDFNVKKLDEIVSLLKEGGHLDVRHSDHELKGEFVGIRECHIQNDILLMYRKEEDTLILLLIDIGTHSSLFR